MWCRHCTMHTVKRQMEMSRGHSKCWSNYQYGHMLCFVPLDKAFYLWSLKSFHSKICVCWWRGDLWWTEVPARGIVEYVCVGGEGWGWGWKGWPMMDRGIIKGESMNLIRLAFLKLEISTDPLSWRRIQSSQNQLSLTCRGSQRLVSPNYHGNRR